jgi:hypothetical protein
MKRLRTRSAALVAAMSLLATPAVALAETDPPQEPVPVTTEETPTPISADVTPTAPLRSPTDNRYAFGQSMQIRVNADGEPNSDLVNFRWSVGQLTVQAPPDVDETITVPVPEQGVGARYLNRFGSPDVENGVAELEVPVSDGFGLQRTVSLAPGDFQPRVTLKAEFTLDGTPVKAQEIVGKSGVVTARYTITNLTAQPTEVTVNDLAGQPVTRTVNAMQPMLVIAGTLLPQRYTGLNLGTGAFGADGRGNNQVQWVALPFAPLSPSGSASFGWSANVTDGEIPEMIVQVAPIYIPPDADPETAQQAARNALGGLPVNLDPAVAQISGGVASLLAGLNGFAEQAAESGDPLEQVQDAINDFFQEFGTNLQNVASLLNPENPESVTALVTEVSGVLAQVNDALATLQEQLTPERIGQLQLLADNWGTVVSAVRTLQQALPYLITTLETGLPIDCRLPDPAQTAAPGQIGVGQLNRLIIGGNYRGHVPRERDLPAGASVSDSYTFGNGVTAGAAIWRVAEGEEEAAWQTGGLPSQSTACAATVTAANAVIRSQAPPGLAEELKRLQPLLDQIVQTPIMDPNNVAEIQAALQFLATNLSGIVVTLTPLTALFSEQLASLANSLAALNQQVSVIATGLQAANVDLPALDAVVAELVGQVLASPNGQLVTGGIGQIQSGIGSAVQELSTFIAAAIVQARGLAGDADEAVVAVRASVAGLLTAAGASPLVYGEPDPRAPADTVLAGAYEFRVDAADRNAPLTLPRILLGFAALLAAGLLGYSVRKSAEAQALATPDAGPVLVPVGAGASAADHETMQLPPITPPAGGWPEASPSAAAAPAADRATGPLPPITPPAGGWPDLAQDGPDDGGPPAERGPN